MEKIYIIPWTNYTQSPVGSCLPCTQGDGSKMLAWGSCRVLRDVLRTPGPLSLPSAHSLFSEQLFWGTSGQETQLLLEDLYSQRRWTQTEGRFALMLPTELHRESRVQTCFKEKRQLSTWIQVTGLIRLGLLLPTNSNRRKNPASSQNEINSSDPQKKSN